MMEWRQISEITSSEELKKLKIWLFKENVRLENEKKELLEIQNKILQERVQFRDEMNALNHKMVVERKRLKDENAFFEKKLQILQEGFRQLDLDRRVFEKEKQRFQRERECFREESHKSSFLTDITEKASAGMFFKGVTNPLALRKRYRDLMKIYHPDNACGDAEVVQYINKEFDSLKEK